MMAIPSISIDYAVMEKTTLGKVVACDPGWSDLGSFDALYEDTEPRKDGNRVLSSLPPVFVEARNNLVVGSGRQIALIDVEGLIVVDTADALLITKRGSTQKVKHVVSLLKPVL
jgi:mannose-1-phosphate guanylyltransferase